MFAPLAESTRQLLADERVVLTFVDVGARNGVIELAELAQSVDAYGFEPNPREFEKLESGETGTKLIGIPPPPYRSLRHFPYALGERDGRATLYVTRATGGAGLRPPDVERLREIVWKAKTFERSLGDDYFEVVGTEEVEVRTLRSFAAEAVLDHVDYLKIDVEGTEYEVLEGAGGLLGATGVVRVEVCFIPFRVEQKLFSDVDLLLRSHGFDLLRYEILPAHVGYKVRTRPVTWGPAFGFPDRHGQPLQADAVYVNRAIGDPVRAAAQAAVLIDLNYLDEAAFVLARNGKSAPLVELLRRIPRSGRSTARCASASTCSRPRGRRGIRPRRSARGAAGARTAAGRVTFPSSGSRPRPMRSGYVLALAWVVLGGVLYLIQLLRLAADVG